MLVVGAVGSGKTVAMRHILLQHSFIGGAAIILIDLNGDYKDFCKALGGCWIDADSDYVACPHEVLSALLLVFDLSDLNRATDEFRFRITARSCRELGDGCRLIPMSVYLLS